MTEIDSRTLLSQLARYTASGTLSSQYSLPVLGRLADETTPPLDGERLIEALLAHRDPAIAAMAPRVAAARQTEAARLHTARRDKRLSTTRTMEEEFPLLADLPLDAPLEWQALSHTLKQLTGALSLAKDVRFAAERRSDAPQTAARLDEKLRASLGDSVEAIFPCDRRLVRAMLNRSRQHCSGDASVVAVLDRLETALAEREQEDKAAAIKAVDNLPAPISAELDDEDVLTELLKRHRESSGASSDGAGDRSGGEGGHRWLDALCVWPRANVAERLNEALQSNSDRERASLIFTLRAGARNVSGWSGWRNWLMQSGWTLEREQKYLAQLVQQRPVELLALWCRQNADADAVAVLEDWCQTNVPAVDADRLAERWEEIIPDEELSGLFGGELVSEDDFLPDLPDEPVAKSAPVPVSKSVPESVSKAAALSVETEPAELESVVATPLRAASQTPLTKSSAAPTSPVKPAPPKLPPPPSVWRDHVQPFFAENWYMVAGVLMVIAGSSLLA
ncbi:MAG: hypothetical protein ISQ06_15280, partial [Planctomycetaceae bacterium]|nr:hypothetical protein [Planctomycetaceae bacterium]